MVSAGPNFLIAGAPRCGTTAMYVYLKQHPEVYLSVFKEPHFFGSDLTRQPHTVRDRDLYLSLFAGAGEALRIGEGSVWYLRSTRAACEIARFDPGMKILLLLRDPLDAIRSLHALYLRTGNEDLDDLGEALAAEPERAAGERLPPRHYFPEGLQYRRNVAYAAQVERYLSTFAPDQVEIVIYEEFRLRPLEVLARVATFLGIEPTFQPELDLDRAEEAIRDLVLPQLKRADPRIRARLRAWHHHHRGPKARIDPLLHRQLRAELAPGIVDLETLIDRDLQRWWRDR